VRHYRRKAKDTDLQTSFVASAQGTGGPYSLAVVCFVAFLGARKSRGVGAEATDEVEAKCRRGAFGWMGSLGKRHMVQHACLKGALHGVQCCEAGFAPSL